MYSRLLIFFCAVVFLFIGLAVGPGCANIVPPQGGPRDTIPPQLLEVNPGDSTRNFSGNRITFEFDEFVDVQNIQENLIVSPTPRITPAVDYKLRTVTVRLRDSLEPNTTYTLNFGNAIKDYNEGNPIKDFTYIFSTGSYIDSLELGGNVVLAENGKIDSTLIVMLHTSPDDSAVIREKPRYVAKLDAQGNFRFTHLPSATFYLYALKDEGGSRRYYDEKQLFAFAGKPIVVQPAAAPVTLYAYATRPATQQPATVAVTVGGRRGAQATVEKRLRYQTNLINNEQDLLGDFLMTFEAPLRSFDSAKVRVAADSVFNPVTGYRIIRDSSNRKIQLLHTWKENTVYHLILEKDFAVDSAGRALLKTDTLTFRTKKLSDYGSLRLRLRNLDLSKNPVLLFVVNDAVLKSFPLSGNEFFQPLFFPGDYELRILYDENRNGKWDPGLFFGRHKQPEIVKPVQRRVIVKPNYQNEIEIVL